jgi:lincosamide nucleotidyltransferase A/C/D/E
VGMTGPEVWELLGLLERDGVQAWVDGGWGVDALLGEQTRAHGDLDLVVAAGEVGTVRRLVYQRGFRVVRDWLPTALALQHADGREVDLHPIEPTEDGGGNQIQREGVRHWHYGPPVEGTIEGRPVRCCSLETQLRAHVGYQPDENDLADLRRLQERFGCDLPPPYDRLV